MISHNTTLLYGNQKFGKVSFLVLFLHYIQSLRGKHGFTQCPGHHEVVLFNQMYLLQLNTQNYISNKAFFTEDHHTNITLQLVFLVFYLYLNSVHTCESDVSICYLRGMINLNTIGTFLQFEVKQIARCCCLN